MKKMLLVLLMGATILTVGCADKNSPTKVSEEVVDNYLEVKVEELDDYKDVTEEEDILMYNLMGEVLEQIKVKYGEETIEGDKATVDITVTGPSYELVFIDSLPQVYELININPQSADHNFISEKIDEIIDVGIEKVGTTSREGTINLSKVDGKWTVDNLDEIENVLLDMQENV